MQFPHHHHSDNPLTHRPTLPEEPITGVKPRWMPIWLSVLIALFALACVAFGYWARTHLHN
jgi:hypothetical protein